jgi:hypothetical protein
MTFLLWVRACGGGGGAGGIALWWQGRILLLRKGGILLGCGGVLLRQGGILLQWGIGCGGSSMHVLVDDAGEYVLHPLQGILKYRYCVLHFDYDGSWRRCTEGRGNSEDDVDTGLSNGAD